MAKLLRCFQSYDFSGKNMPSMLTLSYKSSMSKGVIDGGPRRKFKRLRGRSLFPQVFLTSKKPCVWNPAIRLESLDSSRCLSSPKGSCGFESGDLTVTIHFRDRAPGQWGFQECAGGTLPGASSHHLGQSGYRRIIFSLLSLCADPGFTGHLSSLHRELPENKKGIKDHKSWNLGLQTIFVALL